MTEAEMIKGWQRQAQLEPFVSEERKTAYLSADLSFNEVEVRKEIHARWVETYGVDLRSTPDAERQFRQRIEQDVLRAHWRIEQRKEALLQGIPFFTRLLLQHQRYKESTGGIYYGES